MHHKHLLAEVANMASQQHIRDQEGFSFLQDADDQFCAVTLGFHACNLLG